MGRKLFTLTRLKSGAWVAIGGFVATALTVLSQNIGQFELEPKTEAIIIVIATAVITQITKALNTKYL